MRIKGILFDKDGTLLDFHASWMPLNHDVARFAARGDETLARRLLAHSGYDAASGRVRSGTPLAAGTPDEIATVFGEVHGDLPADLPAEINRIFGEGAERAAVPVPGLGAALRRFRERTSFLGIATHDSRAGITASLGPHDVLHLFDFLAGFDSGHGKKPGPGMALAFCRETGLAPAEICVIGDNLHDLEMGRAAGAALRIGVLTGTSTAEELAPHADLVLDSIADLASDAAFLDRLA